MLNWLPLEVRDEGVTKGYATAMDFVGAGVSVVFVAGAINRAIVSIAGGSSSDIATTVLRPAVDESLAADLSAVAVRSYTIASGKKLTLGLASRFRIL